MLVCVHPHARMCVLDGVCGGVLLHLKFHNICSIGSAIYTAEAGAFMGSRRNWGVGACA